MWFVFSLVVVPITVAVTALFSTTLSRLDPLSIREDIHVRRLSQKLLVDVPLKPGGGRKHVWDTTGRPWLAVREDSDDHAIQADSALADTQKVFGNFLGSPRRGIFVLSSGLLGRRLLLTPHVRLPDGRDVDPFVNAIPTAQLAGTRLSAWAVRFDATESDAKVSAVLPTGFELKPFRAAIAELRENTVVVFHAVIFLLIGVVALFYACSRITDKRGKREFLLDVVGRDVALPILVGAVSFVLAERLLEGTLAARAASDLPLSGFRVGRELVLDVPMNPRQGEEADFRIATKPRLGVEVEGLLEQGYEGEFGAPEHARAIFFLPDSLIGRDLLLKPQVAFMRARHEQVRYMDCRHPADLYWRAGEDEVGWKLRADTVATLVLLTPR